MPKLGTISYKGKSGKTYSFTIYSFDTQFSAVGGVYFVNKRTKQSDNSHTHKRIYLGQTGDLSERFDDHHKADCFKEHKANCICVHRDDNEKSRLAKEDDLLKVHKPPCND